MILDITNNTASAFVDRIDSSVNIDKNRPEPGLHHHQFHALVEEVLGDAAARLKEIGFSISF